MATDKKKPFTNKSGEIRPLTEKDIDTMRPAAEVMPKSFMDGMRRMRGQRGPQKSPRKVPVSIRLRPDLLEAYKKSGRGWQGRMEQILQQALDDGQV